MLADLAHTLDNHAWWCAGASHIELLETMSVTLDAALQSSEPGSQRYSEFEALSQLVFERRRDYV